MKKISKQAVRSKSVENILASLRIEQLTPGDYVVKGMNACVSGKNTTANVLQEVMRHHVTGLIPASMHAGFTAIVE